MLKLTVARGQADGPPISEAELRSLAALPAAEAWQALRRHALRLRQLEPDPLPYLSALRILFDAAAALPSRAAAGEEARRWWLWLHEECARLAAADGGLPARRDGRWLASALALASGWRLAGLCALRYAPLPAGFWQGCHRVFADARAQRWYTRLPAEGLASAGVSYRKLLLLGISGGNRLQTARLQLLLAWLEGHGGRLALQALPSGRREACWRVELNADLPARFAEPETAAGAGWLLDAEPVLRALRAAMEGGAQTATAAEWQLLARLEGEWSQPPQRRHLRLNQRNGQRVQLLAGFERCWQMAHDGAPSPQTPPAELLVLNLSAAGIRLGGELAGLALQAGEPVMLKRRGFGWQLGLVRWISLPDDPLPGECGVEFVGKRPLAVEAAAVTSLDDGTMAPGLLLQAERRFLRRGVLLLPGRAYQPLRPFRLRAADGEWLVRAQRLLQQTGACQLMEVSLDERVE
ncbi:hypothetical protein [Chromobacterium sp. ATCC 53434]|uniref:hypothetical protein n=1 Tax=Chromobacterium sp. (strain ATCC 53434 / SC 14030) TaxID=2059672 RepID=UPI00130520EA|nr:hypothetical protein [Chromobacterium sp. ATCC 53434]